MEKIELFRSVPVLNVYDVIVVGAGPAGICAAVTAARSGMKTALIERYGTLGGNLTVGHVGPILGSVGPGTIRDELMTLLQVPDNDELGVVGVAHDFEQAKVTLVKYVDDAGVDTYLQSPVVEVIKENNHIKAVIIGGKEGLFALSGDIYIDATGDGDVASMSGCKIMMGRDSDNLVQPVTLEFLIDQVDENRAITCIGEVDNVKYKGEPFLEYTKRHCEMGHLPKHLASVRLHRTTVVGQRNVNTTQANRINPLNPLELMKAEVELRKQVEQIVTFLRTYVEGYEQTRVISSASTLGVRETRRVKGAYVLTEQDVIRGRHFEDVIVHNACFIVDIHNPAGSGQASGGAPAKAKPYDIPYRCFVPDGIDNLYVSGRCISGTHEAHASYRVMSICMAMGQAVAVAAACCVKQGKIPRTLPFRTVQDELGKLGVILFEE